MQRLRKKLRRFRIENDGIRSFWKHWTITGFHRKTFHSTHIHRNLFFE